jgi:hypothetical protein
MTFCGKEPDGIWMAGGYAAPGVQVWRDHEGEIHIRGEADFSGSNGNLDGQLFFLPPAQRPKIFHAFPVATGASAGAFQAGSAILLVQPDGLVAMTNSSLSTTRFVFIGEATFRTDV